MPNETNREPYRGHVAPPHRNPVPEREAECVQAAIGRIVLSITSGNEVPVRRATVAADDLRALLADHARLQLDARRYRVLRDYLLRDEDSYEALIVEPEPTNAAEFDAAMDAAIAKAVQP